MGKMEFLEKYKDKKCKKCDQVVESKPYSGIPSILNSDSNVVIETKLKYAVGCGCKESVFIFDSDIYPTLDSAKNKWLEDNLEKLE